MLLPLAIAVRRDVQEFLEVHAVVDQVLRDVGQSLNLLGGLVRLPATNRCTSPTARVSSVSAASRSDLLSLTRW